MAGASRQGDGPINAARSAGQGQKKAAAASTVDSLLETIGIKQCAGDIKADVSERVLHEQGAGEFQSAEAPAGPSRGSEAQAQAQGEELEVGVGKVMGQDCQAAEMEKRGSRRETPYVLPPPLQSNVDGGFSLPPLLDTPKGSISTEHRQSCGLRYSTQCVCGHFGG